MAEAFLTELRCAEALARSAGKAMLRDYRKGFSVDFKGKQDLVTDVDLSIERFVIGELRSLFPDDAIFGEEYGPKGDEGRRTWLIDPIDGTINFSQGIPFCCVSLALQVDGESVLGVVYDPSRDELFSARRGDGARLDGVQMTVSERSDFEDSVLATGFPPPRDDHEVDNHALFVEVARECRGIRRLGSAALDLAYVAAGRLDGFWEFHLNPWDTAAGYLLVKEAGGRTTDADGASYTGHQTGVVATNGKLHDTLLHRLQEDDV